MSAEKNKLKNETTGRLRYWWNLYLFARGFEFEVDSTPDAIADQITRLHDPGRRILGFGDARGRIVNVSRMEDESTHAFDVRAKRTNNGVTYTSVRATGRVIYSQGYGTTIARGYIRLGWFYLTLIIVSIAAFLGGLLIGFMGIGDLDGGMMLLMIPVFVAFNAFFFWQIRTDYKTLTHDLMRAISAGAVESLNDLAPDDDESPFISEEQFEQIDRKITHDI